MKICDGYSEMISAYVDGELTDAETAALEEHLKTCEECWSALNAYREIALAISEDYEEVPPGFAEGVMQRVDNAEKKRRRGRISVITRWACAAACIAIVALVSPNLPNLGCGSVKSANDCTVPMNSSGDRNGAGYDGGGEDTSDFVGEAYDGTSEMSGNLTEEQKSEDRETADNASGTYDDSYSMVITVHGDGAVPEMLEGTLPDGETDGEKYWIIDTADAQELLKEHGDEYETERLDEEAPYALVIVTE